MTDKKQLIEIEIEKIVGSVANQIKVLPPFKEKYLRQLLRAFADELLKTEWTYFEQELPKEGEHILMYCPRLGLMVNIYFKKKIFNKYKTKDYKCWRIAPQPPEDLG